MGDGIHAWALPALALLLGSVAGIAAGRVLRRRLEKAPEGEAGAGRILAASIRGLPLLVFTAGGFYAATLLLPSGAAARWALSVPAARQALLAAVILAASWAAGRFAGGLLRRLSDRAPASIPQATLAVSLVRAAVLLLGILVLLQTLGVAVSPLLTALGIGGLSLGLALQGTLANLLSGLQILLSRQIRPGEFIRLDTGEEGYVEDITLRTTTVRTLLNSLVVVPNARFVSAVVTNYDRPTRELAVLVPAGVSYESDLGRVERVTVEVAREVLREVPGGIPEFEPLVRYHTFGDSGVQFTVVLRGRTFVDQHLLKHEFVKRLHERYRREGIEIPFPTRTIHVRKDGGPVG